MAPRRLPARLGWALIIVLTVTAGSLWALTKRDRAPAAQGPAGGGPPAMPVMTAPVKMDTILDQISTVGTLQANESVVIRSEITGRIQAIQLSEGQQAAQGDTLITIDPAEYRAQYEQAAATLKLTQLNFERAKSLLDEQLISQQAFDELATRLEESGANQALAKARLDKTTIQAPFDGRLGLRQVSPGDVVQSGQAIVNLEDIDPLKVDFRVPEMYLDQIRIGGAIQAGVDAFPGEHFDGSIYAIDPRIDEASRTLVVRARISNIGARLRPGMFARVTAVLTRRPNALLVPEQAIVPKGAEKFVYRVIDGKAVLTPVVLGRRRTGEVEIVQGVGPKDIIVTDGQTKLTDGAAVMVVEPGGGPPADAIAPPAPRS